MTLVQMTDADVADIQERFKIPVGSTYVGSFWIVSLDRQSLLPTEKELLQIQSYREFTVRDFYGYFSNEETVKRILAESPFPADRGHNTITFCKGLPHLPETKGSWFYRASTWRIGPTYVPNLAGDDPYRPHTLLELLNLERERTCSSRFIATWQEWKRKNPEIFS